MGAVEAHTSVHAEYSVIDYDRECQEIKHVGEVCPDVRRTVFSYTLGIETISLSE